MRLLARRTALRGSAATVAAPRHAAPGPGVLLPLLSTAVAGLGLLPGWLHEGLPKVERANTFVAVPDGGVCVLCPAHASAVGADTDNTGASVETWFGIVLLGAA